MNHKRKAELQRKLAMTSVPKPPEGLADRIKADIPHDLAWTHRERKWFFPSPALSLRIAASIIVLVASAYVVLHLLTRYELESVMPNVIRQKSVAETPAPPAPPAELTISVAEAPKRAVAAPAKPAPRPVMQTAERDELKKQAPAPAGFAPEMAAKDKQELPASEGTAAGAVSVTANAPAIAAAAPPPQSEMPSTAQQAPAIAAPAARGAAPSRELAKTARAADLSFAPPREVFGLSIDPSAFDRVKQKIDRGQRPEPASIDVAGLVNYFGGSAPPPKREVRLDVEGSRAPTEPNSALIRFTIETPHADVAPGASIPPVATDADLAITLNSDAVISHRLFGADSLKAQSRLVMNTSVTGMLEIELNPAVRPVTTIATLRLRYRSASDGKQRTVVKSVRASEVMRSWDSASRRHKLATLGGVWSESLTRSRTTGEVAHEAEKLATEAPNDARARELAAAASAFSRLQSSGPTGSGR